ncbi:hypothetical protein BDZ97DRAFT_1800866 [Flammula alnicola]|nr:hypothetical protein BDZ97DRAFT_1800866 [Flammula alnicola]
MSPSPSPRDIHPISSATSELDSLSDSDWLDIASGRDSDDNDSLSDQDSDRDEISSIPRSRRSSISNDDSMNSDVEAWEGFVSDSGDEPEAVIGMYPVPLPSPLGAEPIALGFMPDPVEAVDPAIAEEDQRVKEALDQSFVGTLSSSRSSSGAGHPSSAHTSIRDLRLSFPDPLTSSRDELNTSYETVSSPTETSVSSSTDDEVNVPEPAPLMVASPLLEDPGLLPTTPGVRYQHHEVQLASESKDELEIVLYGSSSEIKWKFLQELIQKAATTSGHIFINSLRENEQIQTLRFIKNSEGFTPFFNIININDRTIDSSTKAEIDDFDSPDHPSLAIVYLPAAKLPILSWHTTYLPVLVPSITDLENTTLQLGSSKSTVFNAEELGNVDATHVYEELRNIGHDPKKITALKPLTEQVKSMNAVTLYVRIDVDHHGFAFNTAFRPPTPSPTPTINTPSSSNGHLWGLFAPQPNRSVLTASPGCQHSKGGNTIDATPSLKDMAMSVFNPGNTALSVASPPSSMSLIVASTSKAVLDTTTTSFVTKCQQCGAKSGASAEKPRASTDVVLRSTAATSLSEVSHMKPPTSVIASRTDSRATILLAGADRAGGIPTAANIKLNSVSEVLDATTKALAEAMGNDLAELVQTADELMVSIREQTDNVIRQSKGKARAFGEQMQNLNEEVVKRNTRAKKRARELKKKGEEMVRDARKELKEKTRRAKKELKEKTGKARKRAKALRQSVVEGGAEAWKRYEKSQEEWESVLLSKKEDRAYRDAVENANPQGKGCRKSSSRWSLKANKKVDKAICV